MKLIVKEPFESHAVGDEITDEKEIAAVLASHPRYVSKVAFVAPAPTSSADPVVGPAVAGPDTQESAAS